MTAVLFALLGGVAAAVTYFLTKSMLNSELTLRANYSGKKIPTLGGLIVLVALLIAASVVIFIPDLDNKHHAPLEMLFIALGFGFIGLLDDLIGDKSSQGFRGHLSALFHGQITTGALKLFGGPIIAFIALSSQIPDRGYIPVLIDVIAISLIANFFNLLDLAPGRCCKYVLVTLGICAWVAPTPAFQYCIMAIIAVVLILDIRESLMLGDTGANAIGAIVGLTAVSCSSDFATIIVALVAFALNLLSEFVSYSSIIEKLVPLRAFDHLGQTPERRSFTRK